MTLPASCVAPATSTSTIDNSTLLWVSLEKDAMVFPEMLSSNLLDLPMLKKKKSKKKKPTKAISRENKSEIRTTLTWAIDRFPSSQGKTLAKAIFAYKKTWKIKDKNKQAAIK